MGGIDPFGATLKEYVRDGLIAAGILISIPIIIGIVTGELRI